MKSALEALTNVGTVNVTREERGGDNYAWLITFAEPAISSHSADIEEGTEATSALLSYPLLYAGGEDEGAGLGIETLGTGGEINATRVQRGTLGPLAGEVMPFVFGE